MPLPYLDRRMWLLDNVLPTPHVHVVDATRVMTKDEVKLNYDCYVKGLHYEGIVVKSGDSRLIMGVCPWVKIKKKETSEGKSNT